MNAAIIEIPNEDCSPNPFVPNPIVTIPPACATASEELRIKYKIPAPAKAPTTCAKT